MAMTSTAQRILPLTCKGRALLTDTSSSAIKYGPKDCSVIPLQRSGCTARQRIGTSVTALTDADKDWLPNNLRRARAFRQAGLTCSAVTIGAGAAAALMAGMRPPAELIETAAFAATAVPISLLGAKATLGDNLHLEWHDNRVHIEFAVVNRSQPAATNFIEVRPTSDGRGNGAFATAIIPRGSFIGTYEGDLLSETAYWTKYPSGVSDYCIRVDAEWTIDGATRAQDTTAFSACHINHGSGDASNVARHTYRHEKVVRFYAQRDIEVDEELLLDYGSVYWTGREHLIVP